MFNRNALYVYNAYISNTLPTTCQLGARVE